MKFVFWQSILSIHQSTFLNALSKEHNVTLVVERETDQVRKQSGWENPTLGCNRVIIAPDARSISKLIAETADHIHVISGLEMTFQNHQLTKRLTNLNYRVICYLEPFRWLGMKGLARTLKYTLLRIKYGNKISAMLPTGRLGANQYGKIGFKHIYEWGYFTEITSDRALREPSDSESTPTLLFVGSLDERKNIIGLINVMNQPILKGTRLSIIGDGPLRDEVVSLAAKNPNISYLGVKHNEEVKNIMAHEDILILPSIFDGWGAVVNEALSAGMRAICSDHCGAASLLEENWRGSVFSFDRPNDMANKIEFQLKLGPQSESSRKRLIDWCNHHISGKTAAEYFIRICEYQFLGIGQRPIAPWRIE